MAWQPEAATPNQFPTAPAFAFVDFGAAGLAVAVLALVDFAAVAFGFAVVLFAAIPIFLHGNF